MLVATWAKHSVADDIDVETESETCPETVGPHARAMCGVQGPKPFVGDLWVAELADTSGCGPILSLK